MKKLDKYQQYLQKNDIPVYVGHLTLVNRFYKEKPYDVVISPNAVMLLYIDDDDNVWLTEQYRPAQRKTCIALPAETLDKEDTPLERAVAGLKEECGLEINKNQVQTVMSITSSDGHDSEIVHLFKAYGPHKKTGQNLDEGNLPRGKPARFPVSNENIKIRKGKFEDMYKQLMENDTVIKSNKTVILFQHEMLKRKQDLLNKMYKQIKEQV